MAPRKSEPAAAAPAPAQAEICDVPAPVSAPEAAATKEHKFRKPTDLFWRNKIAHMDPALRAKLDGRLRRHAFRSYRELARWLGEQGFEISARALSRYGKSFDGPLDAVRIATAQAKAIVEETGCDSEEVEKALLQLVQTELFGVLVEVQHAKRELEPSALCAIARATSSLVMARVSAARLNEKIRAQVDKGVAVVLARIDSERGRGLSIEGAEQIRAALLEIVDEHAAGRERPDPAASPASDSDASPDSSSGASPRLGEAATAAGEATARRG